MISVFDIFKIGIGPSSSHTVGPMKAGKAFMDELAAAGLLASTTRLQVDVYGSLSLTGKGHHTDIAIIMGLAGNLPDSVDIDSIAPFIAQVQLSGRLPLTAFGKEVDFVLPDSLKFHDNNLPRHENGMKISAYAQDTLLHSQTYYSIGGGFIVTDAEFGESEMNPVTVPYPFNSAADLQKHCDESGLSLSAVMMQNELALNDKSSIEAHFAAIWQVMKEGIERGIHTEGMLPGPMKVRRRAAALRNILVTQGKNSIDPMGVVDWINMYAMAVNEENAAGGRVVTAPTNGACGIIPAVLTYYDQFIRPLSPDASGRFFLAAGAVGALFKMNASISGAEVGCQEKSVSHARWQRQASQNCWAVTRFRYLSLPKSRWNITSGSPAIRSPGKSRFLALSAMLFRRSRPLTHQEWRCVAPVSHRFASIKSLKPCTKPVKT
jgi:L-serine dehydratase